ncbi:MAG: NYN domain-containing protein [Pseudomonadota bacterium]
MEEKQVAAAGLGALLVDIENLYLAIADEYGDPVELTLLVLQNLREHVKSELGVSVVIGRAYAPLDYSSSRMFINDLSLMGIQPVHVLARPEKNSADLMLSIDCMELLYGRRDIGTFVIVGGDRDYIPVAERILQNARRVFIVCPKHAMSGDLLTIIGDESYLDAVTLIPPEQRTPVSWKRIVQREKRDEAGDKAEAVPAPPPAGEPQKERAEPRRPGPARAGPAAEAPAPATMDDVEKLVRDGYELEDLKRAASLILKFQRDNRIKEVWLSPFLRVMNNAFPMKSNAQRKELIGRLCSMGAVRIEERPRTDDSGTFTVITINWRHPLIIEANPG